MPSDASHSSIVDTGHLSAKTRPGGRAYYSGCSASSLQKLSFLVVDEYETVHKISAKRSPYPQFMENIIYFAGNDPVVMKAPQSLFIESVMSVVGPFRLLLRFKLKSAVLL